MEDKLICPFLIITIGINSWELWKLLKFYKSIIDTYARIGGIYNIWNAAQIFGTENYKNAQWRGGTVIIITIIAVIWGITFIRNKTKDNYLRIAVFILLAITFIIAFFAVKYWIFAVVIVGVIAVTFTSGES